jgi:hypothetical protein
MRSLAKHVDVKRLAPRRRVLGGAIALVGFGLLMPYARAQDGGTAAGGGVNIPPSKHSNWDILRKTQVKLDFKRGTYVATHPAATEALNGTSFEIEGFVTPVKAETSFRHFLLMPMAPGCSFCPPPEFNEIIEVTSRKPITAELRVFRVRGKFSTQNNGKEGLFFRIEDADVD